MNEFYLIDENNTRFSLKDFTEKAFIPSLKGIGYKHSLSYTKVGDYFKTNYKEIAQGTMSATTVFSSYENYQNFINFIENANELRLIYKPIDVEYFRDVDFDGVSNVTRGASTTEAEISLFCKSLYYTATDTRFEVVPIEGQSQYDLLFDYTFNDYASTEIVFTNSGHVEAQLVAEIYGFIENPKIELYQENVLISTVSFNETVLDGDKLIYSARDGNNYIVYEDSDGVQTNAIDILDLANENFFKIPKGTVKFVISSDTGLYSKITFRIITSYKGV